MVCIALKKRGEASVAGAFALFRRVEHLDGQVAVGEHADLGRDRHRLAADRLGVCLVIHQRARRGEGIITAAASAADSAAAASATATRPVR